MSALAQLAMRFELLPPRQRLIAFGAAAFTVLGISFVLFSLPPWQERSRLEDANRLKAAQKTKLEREQAEASGANAKDVDAGNKQRIAALKKLIEEANSGLSKRRDRLVPPERMPKLIEEVIARVPNLELVELRSVAPTALFENEKKAADSGKPRDAKADPKADAKAASAAESGPGIFRHGVIVEVRGDYLELLQYVRALERLPLQVFWNEVMVRNDEASGKPVMRLSLFTLSLEKTWLKV